MNDNHDTRQKERRRAGAKTRRPDPEKLLAKIKAKETESAKGKLKIFLGFAAGVGKTYAMLESAHKLLKAGMDVVAGCVVTHGRAETEALLSGLEVIPPKVLEYKGAKLEEFDLDAALSQASFLCAYRRIGSY